MFGGMCHGAYAAALARTLPVFINAGVMLQYSYVMNESLVTRARDKLANDFLETGCTHLMFIDSDIGFSGEDILTMAKADKDVIFGAYSRKEIDWLQVADAVRSGVAPEDLSRHTGALVVNTLPGAPRIEDVEAGEPVEVMNGGTGFMLIRRGVLEGLLGRVPTYTSGGRVFNQFFDTAQGFGGVLLSEDFAFCELVRRYGFQVWVAPWVELTHTGTYQFSGKI